MIYASARRHGITDTEIRAVVEHPIVRYPAGGTMSNDRDLEARYTRLADAVEAGHYEVIERSVEVRQDYRPGRPRRGDAAEETRPLAVRLTDADRRRLAEYAERTGQPMSAVIRAAIDEYLSRHPAA